MFCRKPSPLRRHSLSGRLIGLFLLTGLALALVVKTGFHYAFQENLRDLARPHVAEYVQYLLARIGDPPDTARAAALAERLPLDIHISGPSLYWSSAGRLPDLDQVEMHRHRLPSGDVVQAGRSKGGFFLAADRSGYRIILKSQGLETTRWAPLATILTIVAALAVLSLTYHGIRRLFHPLETVRTGLARIGRGELEHRIQVKRKDELGELADSVNAMANDIRDMLEAKRQLLLAISHELRSPLTRAWVNLALLPDSDTRGALERDLTEMEALIGELLESERLNTRHAPLNLSAEDPAALVREVIAEQFAHNTISTQLDTGGGYAALDAVRFKLLVRNLLNNALQHTPDDAEPPSLFISLQTDTWSLVVRDHGPGIPLEHLAHVTEPFYRADPSRRRETGGYGLGLYLCRAIVEAHRGRLQIESSDPKGTQIRAVFPVAG